MKTLFISDIHLDSLKSPLTHALLSFLRDTASDAEALYILGDLFESYIGDDEDALLHQAIAHALAQLAQRGTKVFLLNGNRDFLVGETFARRCKATLLKEPYTINLYGIPTLLLHGDTLCTEDKAYQRLRRVLRHPLFCSLGLKLPLTMRKYIADKLRNKSQYAIKQKSLSIMDVTQKEVEKVLQENKVSRLIHGHTHRPAIHHFYFNNQQGERIVLGAWDTRAEYLEATPNAATLKEFVFVR